jgi:hypothetical protein
MLHLKLQMDPYRSANPLNLRGAPPEVRNRLLMDLTVGSIIA